MFNEIHLAKFKDHRVAYYFDNNVFLYLDRSDLSEFISFNDSKTEDIMQIILF